jgi:hypothetical protein
LLVFYSTIIIKRLQNLQIRKHFRFNNNSPDGCHNHRYSINRPTKRGKEKSQSDGHYQCEKEMDDHLLACQQIFEKEPRSDTPY